MPQRARWSPALATAADIAAWALCSVLLAAAAVEFVTPLIGIAVVPCGVLLVIAYSTSGS